MDRSIDLYDSMTTLSLEASELLAEISRLGSESSGDLSASALREHGVPYHLSLAAVRMRSVAAHLRAAETGLRRHGPVRA